MSEPHKWRSYFAAPVADRALLLLTLILTVVADLTFAIAAGIVISMMLRFWRGAAVEPEKPAG